MTSDYTFPFQGIGDTHAPFPLISLSAVSSTSSSATAAAVKGEWASVKDWGMKISIMGFNHEMDGKRTRINTNNKI